jgi:hypothetical protein
VDFWVGGSEEHYGSLTTQRLLKPQAIEPFSLEIIADHVDQVADREEKERSRGVSVG